MSSATLTVPTKVSTFSRKIDLVIETDDGTIRGHINVNFRAMSKPEFHELVDQGLPDNEFIKRVVTSVNGLGGEDGTPYTGDRAIEEVLTGKLSMWLMPAIIQEFTDSYGHARRGNSRARR